MKNPDRFHLCRSPQQPTPMQDLFDENRRLRQELARVRDEASTLQSRFNDMEMKMLALEKALQKVTPPVPPRPSSHMKKSRV